jgi:hypothetical protein
MALHSIANNRRLFERMCCPKVFKVEEKHAMLHETQAEVIHDRSSG